MTTHYGEVAYSRCDRAIIDPGKSIASPIAISRPAPGDIFPSLSGNTIREQDNGGREALHAPRQIPRMAGGP